jgi:hypothetical protein
MFGGGVEVVEAEGVVDGWCLEGGMGIRKS